jgi:hypothetical protein
MVHPYTGILLSNKREKIIDTNTTSESQNPLCYVKETRIKTIILHDSIYKASGKCKTTGMENR